MNSIAQIFFIGNMRRYKQQKNKSTFVLSAKKWSGIILQFIET